MASIISVSPSAADESVGSGFGGVLSFQVTLSEPSADAVSVSYMILPGSARIGIDAPFISEELTFAPGELTRTIEFRASSDNLDETDESIVLELFNPVGGTLAGSAQTIRVTNFIEDDDGASVDRALFVSSPTIVEGDSGTRTAIFTVSVSEAFTTPTSFNFRTGDGTATAGSDYTALSGQVTFAPGIRSVDIPVQISGDATREPSEYFRLIVDTDGSIADGGITSVGEATLLDDDSGGSAPTLSFSVENTAESVGSGFGGIFTVTMRLSEPSNDAVTVGYRALKDTAQEQIDFPYVNEEVTFAPGETVKVVTFRATSDNVDEADESVVVELFGATGATLAGGAPVLRETAFVLDDDGVGLDRALHVSSPVILEGDNGVQRAIFDITLSRPSTEALSFDYTTQNAGARAGSDYTAVSGTLTFAPGQTRASVAVEVIGDTVAEFTEAFQLVVEPTNALGDGGAGAVGEAIVMDDDTGGALPTFSMVSGPHAPDVTRESVGSGFGGIMTFTVMLSEPSNDTVTVGYRTLPLTAESHTDFPRTTDTLTFAPGETLKTVEFRVVSDGFDEDDEAFALEFFDIDGAAFAGGGPVLRDTAFIIDDDGVGLDRSLQVSSPVLIEGDSGSRTARFELSLSQPSATALTFSYATRDGSAKAGTDYTAGSGTVTFQPGQTFAVVDVAVSGDTGSESSEFFSLVVTPTSALGDGGKGAVGQATLLDDDGAAGLPTLSVSASNARESVGSGFGGTVDFVVTLSEPSVDAITVQYRGVDRTAIGGTDYPDFAGTLTFAPGQTSLTVSPRVTSDSLEETDESFAIELFDPVGAVLAGGVDVLQEAAFILDDDGLGLKRSVHVSDVTLYEPVAGTATATFVVTLSRPFDTATVLNYETVNGTAQAAADFTAQTGTLTFAPGQLEAAVNVDILSDSLSGEGTETFFLSLSAPLPSTLTGASEGSVGTASILQPLVVPVPPTGSVSVNGARNVGATLTANTSAIADQNGLGTFALQWLRDGNAISGATAASYMLLQADLYSTISLRVSYVDGIGTNESVTGQAGVIAVALPTSGNDSITGGSRDDEISGGAGNDTLVGAAGNDTLSGGAGSDTAVFAASSAAATVQSVAGVVSVTIGTEVDTLADIEFLRFTDGTLSLSEALGTGNVLVGTDGNDTLVGGDNDDTISGGLGDDSLVGGAGNDNISGSTGADTVVGGPGNDNIGGGTEGDLILGGDGNDTIGAGLGDDTVDAGSGDDVVGGGGGDDSIVGGSGNDTIGASFGNDTIAGLDGSDDLGGGTGRDVLEGGSGDDRIGGGEGDDTVNGGTGDDFLAGGGRNDVISGDSGNDSINGGDGDDTMTGGDGADIFVFNFFKDGDADIITDFENGVDTFRMVGVENAPGTGLAGKLAALGISDTAAGAQIDYQGHTVLIEGLRAADLTTEDFVFL